MGLIGVELAEVFQNTRIAARKLFDQSSPTLGELLRPLARRVNAFIDSRVHVLEQDRPFTLPALKHFGRATLGEIGELLFRVILLYPFHIFLHIYHLDYFLAR